MVVPEGVAPSRLTNRVSGLLLSYGTMLILIKGLFPSGNNFQRIKIKR